jgi:hypothetical protein
MPSPAQPTRVGVFDELGRYADYLWNQCEQPLGRHNTIQLARWDAKAPHRFVMTWPSPEGGTRHAGGWKRNLYKLMKWPTEPLRMQHSYEKLGHDPARTTVMFYEPPAYLPDEWFALAKQNAARVYAPDPRATHPVVLPSMWTLEWDIQSMRAYSPSDKPLPLVSIAAGAPKGKRLIPGHLARLEFYRKLRRAGVPLALYGRGLPSDVSGDGPIACKGHVMRPARFTLAIENYGEGDQYITEKIWDPLVCWSLPIYFGSKAADKLIPKESFIRLPDLGDAGVQVVVETLRNPSIWNERLEAMAEARRRGLHELRLIEWLARELPGWMP